MGPSKLARLWDTDGRTNAERNFTRIQKRADWLKNLQSFPKKRFLEKVQSWKASYTVRSYKQVMWLSQHFCTETNTCTCVCVCHVTEGSPGSPTHTHTRWGAGREHRSSWSPQRPANRRSHGTLVLQARLQNGAPGNIQLSVNGRPGLLSSSPLHHSRLRKSHLQASPP